MSVNRLEEFETSCRHWVKRLGMDHYRLCFHEDSETQGASVAVDPQYLRAEIKLNSEGFLDESEEDLDYVASHEAVHITMGEFEHVVTKMLEALPPEKAEVYREWYHSADETVTERLTRLLRKVPE